MIRHGLPIIQILLSLSLLGLHLMGASRATTLPLTLITGSTAALIFVIYRPTMVRLTSALSALRQSSRAPARLHLFLHIPALAYLLALQLVGPSLGSMLAFSPLLLAFFLSASLTWKACHTRFRSKIYSIFTLGSRALSVWSLVLTVLGVFYDPTLLTERLFRIVSIYFLLHFAEFAFVVMKVERDLDSETHVPGEPAGCINPTETAR